MSLPGINASGFIRNPRNFRFENARARNWRFLREILVSTVQNRHVKHLDSCGRSAAADLCRSRHSLTFTNSSDACNKLDHRLETAPRPKIREDDSHVYIPLALNANTVLFLVTASYASIRGTCTRTCGTFNPDAIDQNPVSQFSLFINSQLLQ